MASLTRKSDINNHDGPLNVRPKRRRLDVGLWIGGGLVGIILLLGIVGPLILRRPDAMSSYYLVPPGTHGYLLGTDQFGRSEFTRIVWGIRTSLEISFVSIGIASVCGTLIGLFAAKSQRFDMSAMRVMDVLLAFPAMLMAIGIMAMVGPGITGVI